MVLFTAPEDMIIGQSCKLHRKVVTDSAVDGLKTTTRLKESALKYDTEQVRSSSTWRGGREGWEMSKMCEGGRRVKIKE